jgi:DNA-binding NtrC family response regulator
MKSEFDGLIEYLLSNHILLPEAVGLLEKRMIEGALVRSEHNQSTASKELGIHRNTLQRKMVEYGIGNGRTRPRRKPAVRERARRKKISAA